MASTGSTRPRGQGSWRAVGAVAAAVGVGVSASCSAAPADGEAGPPATAEVVQTDLVQQESVAGRLGYGESRPVQGAFGERTLTWLPQPGDRIHRGEQVFRSDDRPTPLLYGGMPLYRTLGPGMKGRDVRMIEENLSELGYGGFTVDDTFTWDTSRAVNRLQKDLGMERTGYIDPGDFVVAEGEVRVDGVQAQLGGAASGALLSVTGTRRVVSIDVGIDRLHMIRKGEPASVELPDGASVEGKVSRVGSVAAAQDGEDADEAAVRVEVSLDPDGLQGEEGLEGIEAAPVSVSVEAGRHEDVLAVPVEALIALREGGYGLRVREKGEDRYVEVETGAFGGGMVEVSGAEVKAGTVVGVPE
ncbi:peptidoglycan-binding protein [Nocardiopsis sp. CNT-189]|uniref:peptidoglycan-binding protein n=1 Tax=Nocardiopsis oceanisediminis TaxID=2816862 RepID=UPI003B32E917